MPDCPLIEAHYLSRVLVVGIVGAVVGEQGHISITVMLLVEFMQVVSGEVDLGLWIPSEIVGKIPGRMGHVPEILDQRGIGKGRISPYKASLTAVVHIRIDDKSGAKLKAETVPVKATALETARQSCHIMGICEAADLNIIGSRCL